MTTLYEQKANKCRHFNGTINDACEAGVKYESVRQPRAAGQGANLPCLKDRSDGCYCEKLSFKTDEEIEAEIEEVMKRFNDTHEARKAIVEHLGGPWKKGMAGASGEIPCPACKSGTLRFSRAGYNGHIHAACSTKGCVAWME